MGFVVDYLHNAEQKSLSRIKELVSQETKKVATMFSAMLDNKQSLTYLNTQKVQSVYLKAKILHPWPQTDRDWNSPCGLCA